MLLTNARILRSDFRFFHGDVRLEQDKIAEIGILTPRPEEPVTDVQGRYLIPGLVETHFHGAMGLDSSAGEEKAFAAFSAFMASRGITTFIPALISSADAVTERYIAAGCAFMDKPAPGAVMAGLYLEGPFISPAYKGAHDAAVLQPPCADKLRRWQELAGGRIRKTVVAPELPGAEETIRWAAANGIVVEIGHSGATYAEAKAGIEWGATLATHTFNAMAPLHHREPGILGAVLTDNRVRCELIGDLGHVAPAVVELVYRLKGADGIHLISDSVSAAGLGDGDYVHPDGRTVVVKDGLARLEDGTIMGSASTILDGVRRLVTVCGIPLEDAVKMASQTPARTMGLDDRGGIAPGKRADFAVLDDDLAVCRTLVGGRVVYERT